jgi:hypothetical protein
MLHSRALRCCKGITARSNVAEWCLALDQCAEAGGGFPSERICAERSLILHAKESILDPARNRLDPDADETGRTAESISIQVQRCRACGPGLGRANLGLGLGGPGDVNNGDAPGAHTDQSGAVIPLAAHSADPELACNLETPLDRTSREKQKRVSSRYGKGNAAQSFYRYACINGGRRGVLVPQNTAQHSWRRLLVDLARNVTVAQAMTTQRHRSHASLLSVLGNYIPNGR